VKLTECKITSGQPPIAAVMWSNKKIKKKLI